MLSLTVIADEPEKVAGLYHLNTLNTYREERFDRLTLEAAQVFNAPIALLSLMGEYRQWFKTLFGFNVIEPDSKSAFYKQSSNTTFVVPDTLHNPSFANNPLVLGIPFIRFFAGQPLVNATGGRLGTLCVIGHQPHWPTPRQLATLHKLATQAIHELTVIGSST